MMLTVVLTSIAGKCVDNNTAVVVLCQHLANCGPHLDLGNLSTCTELVDLCILREIPMTVELKWVGGGLGKRLVDVCCAAVGWWPNPPFPPAFPRPFPPFPPNNPNPPMLPALHPLPSFQPLPTPPLPSPPPSNPPWWPPLEPPQTPQLPCSPPPASPTSPPPVCPTGVPASHASLHTPRNVCPSICVSITLASVFACMLLATVCLVKYRIHSDRTKQRRLCVLETPPVELEFKN